MYMKYRNYILMKLNTKMSVKEVKINFVNKY